MIACRGLGPDTVIGALDPGWGFEDRSFAQPRWEELVANSCANGAMTGIKGNKGTPRLDLPRCKLDYETRMRVELTDNGSLLMQ